MKRSTKTIVTLFSQKNRAFSALSVPRNKQYLRVSLTSVGKLLTVLSRNDHRVNVAGSTPATGRPAAGTSTGGSSITGNPSIDQKPVNSQVSGFDKPGHVSGTRPPGSLPGSGTHQTTEMLEYAEKHRKQWQAHKDAQTRDKLFGQTTTGRVNGQEVAPYSSATLEKNAGELIKAKETALPPSNTTLLKTAAITTLIGAPVTALFTVVSGSVNEALKPIINPATPNATAQDLEEGRLVDHVQKSVFLLVNTVASLRNEAHIEPNLKWIMQSNDERLDSLDEMLKYAETQLHKEASAREITFQRASTGEDKDDIKDRVIDMETRMATLSALLLAMQAKPLANVS